MRVIEGPKRRKSILLRIAVFVFAAYFLTLLVNQQAQIKRKQEQLASVRQEIKIQEIKNDDIKSAASGGKSASSEYVERAAREGLDFAKPEERVYVNIAGK
ncbi:MAG TPA: septum formation initiator [Ruminococcaceae bacterium]|jgi:cell division protein DivIC|nr:septum formation initiator [Oscillospiraceae bacterium]HBG54641.1 septum formation initiator [Oscillospiraceae bacterium]HBQ46121.1 septum formation initiator [Oscillospiraceae bacterium]